MFGYSKFGSSKRTRINITPNKYNLSYLYYYMFYGRIKSVVTFKWLMTKDSKLCKYCRLVKYKWNPTVLKARRILLKRHCFDISITSQKAPSHSSICDTVGWKLKNPWKSPVCGVDGSFFMACIHVFWYSRSLTWCFVFDVSIRNHLNKIF